MKINVLMSTMKQNDYSLLENTNIVNDGIIVNQCNVNSCNEIATKYGNVKWINSMSIGLSRSRNIALKKTDADIGIIADDDLVYPDNLSEIVNHYHQVHSDYDIIAFKIVGINKKFKNYGEKMKRVGFLGSLKLASVELTIKIKSINENNLAFDEQFGSGSTYKMGEENIFLFDALRKKMKIMYIPVEIGKLHIGDSSWFNGYNDRYFRDLGAIYERMTSSFSYLLSLQFLLRKYPLYRDSISFRRAYSNMMIGRKEIKRLLNYEN